MNTDIILSKVKKTTRKSTAFRDGFSFGQDFLVGVFFLAWGFVFIQVLSLSPQGAYSIYGPGMGVIDQFANYFLRTFGGAYSGWSICVSGIVSWDTAEFINAFIMWQVMMTAMMVPTLLVPNQLVSAKPIATKHALFNGNNKKGYPLFYTVQTTCGYLSAWAMFCACAVLVQWLLQSNAILNAGMVIESSKLGGKVLLAAGLIQLFNIKYPKKISVENSRFNFYQQLETQSAFMGGLNIGRKCVLENWPLMSTIFVFGLMNVVMMVVLTLAMILQKFAGNTVVVSKLIAAALIGLGMVYLVA